jgi:hypothetical protein
MTHVEQVIKRNEHAVDAERALGGTSYLRGALHALLAIYYELVARDA